MSLDDHGPCPWPEAEMDCCVGWDDIDAAVQARAIEYATAILWRLTGMRYGICERTVRPCGSTCAGASTYFDAASAMPWTPLINSSGQWTNCAGCECPEQCCCAVCEVILPGIVQEVSEVKVDGAIVASSAFRVDNHRALVRTDGACWPRCQDLSAPDTESGTFSITYTHGMPVPAGGAHALATYACEIAKACAGGPCKLPARVTNLTRDGVTMTLLDPLDFLDDGLTGLPLVDVWVRAVNPDRLRAPSVVYSPDLRPARTQTWP